MRRLECASHAYRACAWNNSTGEFVPGDGVAPPDPRPDPTTPRGDVPPEAHAFAPATRKCFEAVDACDPPTVVAANERASMSAGAAHSHFRVCAGRPDAGLEDCRDDDGELAVVDGHRERGERVSLSETSEADPVGSARATLSLPQCTHAIAFVVAGACVAGSVTAASVTEGISSRKAYAKVGSTARASASRPSAPMAFSDASSLTSAVAVHEPSGLRRGRTACASAAAPGRAK